MSNNLNKRLLQWFSLANHCEAVRTLACAAAGLPFKTAAHPETPADLNDCLILIRMVPELRPFLDTRVAPVSDAWAILVERWCEIESVFLWEAGGAGFSKSKDAPKTAALLSEISSQIVDQSAGGHSAGGHSGRNFYRKISP